MDKIFLFARKTGTKCHILALAGEKTVCKTYFAEMHEQGHQVFSRASISTLCHFLRHSQASLSVWMKNSFFSLSFLRLFSKFLREAYEDGQGNGYTCLQEVSRVCVLKVDLGGKTRRLYYDGPTESQVVKLGHNFCITKCNALLGVQGIFFIFPSWLRSESAK